MLLLQYVAPAAPPACSGGDPWGGGAGNGYGGGSPAPGPCGGGGGPWAPANGAPAAPRTNCCKRTSLRCVRSLLAHRIMR